MNSETSAASAAMESACHVVLESSDVSEMIARLDTVEAFLEAAEEQAVAAFNSPNGPSSRATAEHLANTTSALHAVRAVVLDLDIARGSGVKLPVISFKALGCLVGYDGSALREFFTMARGTELTDLDYCDVPHLIADLFTARRQMEARLLTMSEKLNEAKLKLHTEEMKRTTDDFNRPDPLADAIAKLRALKLD